MIQLQHGIPVPTPDHQRRITRQKWFEVATVVVLIVGGVAWLAWRSSSPATESGPASLSAAAQALLAEGLQERGNERLHDLEFREFAQGFAPFGCTVALAGAAADAPLDLVLITLYPQPGEAAPPDSVQQVVNHVMELGRKLVPASPEALEKAVRTSEFLPGAPRPHDKGVAATNN
ncbi:MAG: hypothetical protein IT368_04530, partial [Candidatus Hydrogenedentes bacterium]|nr:hypothetical protein [Candidatus Hydrogenedentota bacterium]